MVLTDWMRSERHEAGRKSQKANLVLNIISQHFFEVRNVARHYCLQLLFGIRLQLERMAGSQLLGPVLTRITNLLHRGVEFTKNGGGQGGRCGLDAVLF